MTKSERDYEDRVRRTLRILGFKNEKNSCWWHLSLAISNIYISVCETDIEDAGDIVPEIWDKARKSLAKEINKHKSAIDTLLVEE